jgi:DNA-directed RNA polymerase subunit M/transcription elongation factor TFIIS
LADGATPDEDYGHAIYICPKCARLANRFYFKLTSPAGEYEPDYRCQKCKARLLPVTLKLSEHRKTKVVYKDRRMADWKCPECGGNKIVYDKDFIMWD